MGRPLAEGVRRPGSGPGSTTSCYMAPGRALCLLGLSHGQSSGNQVTSADSHLLEPTPYTAGHPGLLGGGGGRCPGQQRIEKEQPKQTRGEADFLLRGMFFPQSLSCFQRTWNSEGLWVGRGQPFLLARAVSSRAGGCRRLLNPGWGHRKEDEPGLGEEGKRPAWQLWDLVGGESPPWVPLSWGR